MNYDTVSIEITAELPLKCLGHNIALDPVEVRGRVWSLSDRPMPDFIEWIAPDGFEGVLWGTGTAEDKMLMKLVDDTLMLEAHKAENLDRLQEAFRLEANLVSYGAETDHAMQLYSRD